MRIVFLRLMTIVVATAAVHSGITGDAMARNDPQRWRCSGLYDVLYRYEIEGFDQRDNGVRLRGDVAQYFCDSGNPDLGITLLQRELQRALFTVPSSH